MKEIRPAPRAIICNKLISTVGELSDVIKDLPRDYKLSCTGTQFACLIDNVDKLFYIDEPSYINEYFNNIVDTEHAVQIEDRYIEIHETEGGYDYTIYNKELIELDGGVYDDESVSIKEALAEIIEDVKNSASDFIRGNVQRDSITTELDYESFSFALSIANEI